MVVITKHFIAQTSCETRINGISIHRHLDLEEFKKSLEEKGYYSDDSILCFNGLVVRKDYNTITVNDKPAVITSREKVNNIFKQLVETVDQMYSERNAFRKKVEETMKALEQVQEKVETVTKELENYKNLVSSLQKEIEKLREANKSSTSTSNTNTTTNTKTKPSVDSSKEKTSSK